MHTSDHDAAYDTAQICLHGHVINRESNDKPQHNQKFCSECGASTVNACRSCKTPIRGRYRLSNVQYLGKIPPPLHCHECGKPYPWTGAMLKAARELINEAPNLEDEEREELKQDIDDIVRDTPRAPVAANRFRRLAAKAGKETMECVRSLVVDIVSEVTLKSMGLK